MRTKVSTMGFQEAEGQSSDFYRSHGVSPSELDQKLSHLLIKQQENQIMDLESELHSAQSKLGEKENELQSLKDCVKRLTEFSLSSIPGRSFNLLTPFILIIFPASALVVVFEMTFGYHKIRFSSKAGIVSNAEC